MTDSTQNQGPKRRRAETTDVVVDQEEDPSAYSLPSASRSDPALTPAAIGVPASVWARALSTYLPYEDVRSCAAACRLFAEQVAPLIDRLYVLRSAELHVVPARRYSGVQDVYVYSLNAVDAEYTDEEEEEVFNPYGHVPGTQYFAIDAKTASRAVPFLACFPNLRYVFMGGYDGNEDAQGYRRGYRSTEDTSGTRTDLVYTESLCTTQNHQEIIRGLVRSFCGAYSSGALSQSVRVDGVVRPGYAQKACSVEGHDPACELCREVCSTFPVKIVFGLSQRLTVRVGVHVRVLGFLCLSDRDRYSILAQRPDGRALLQDKETALSFLRGHMGLSVAGLKYPMHGRQDINQLKLLCDEFGNDPKQVDARSLVRALFRDELGEDGSADALSILLRKDFCILRQTHTYLKNLGFDVPSEIRVVDSLEGRWILEYI